MLLRHDLEDLRSSLSKKLLVPGVDKEFGRYSVTHGPNTVDKLSLPLPL